MNVIEDLYSRQSIHPNDDGREVAGRELDHPFEQDKFKDLSPYPQTFHPNILPPTEFMALGMYAG